MGTTIGLLKVAGVAVLALGVAAVGLVVAPAALRGQTVRERPLSHIRTQIMGGSEIGISIRDVDRADVTREKLPSEAGAVVDEVDRDSPAAKAGFRAGDVVVSFDGEKIRSARQLARLIEETPDGREVSTSVVRGGETLALKVTPEAAHGFGAFAPLRDLRDFSFNWSEQAPRAFRTPSPDPLPELERPVVRPDIFGLNSRRGRLGVGLQDLTDQLREYFGAASGGVLVTEVSDDSPARAAGIKAGDVITKVDGRTVRNGGDVARLIAGASGEDVAVTIVRDRKEQTVTAKIAREEIERAPRRIIK